MLKQKSQFIIEFLFLFLINENVYRSFLNDGKELIILRIFHEKNKLSKLILFIMCEEKKTTRNVYFFSVRKKSFFKIFFNDKDKVKPTKNK